jgi:hypothetical protein
LKQLGKNVWGGSPENLENLEKDRILADFVHSSPMITQPISKKINTNR